MVLSSNQHFVVSRKRVQLSDRGLTVRRKLSIARELEANLGGLQMPRLVTMPLHVCAVQPRYTHEQANALLASKKMLETFAEEN